MALRLPRKVWAISLASGMLLILPAAIMLMNMAVDVNAQDPPAPPAPPRTIPPAQWTLEPSASPAAQPQSVPLPLDPPKAFAPQLQQPSFPQGGMPQAGRRFSFKIDSQAPMSTLLPTPPKAPTKLPIWTNEDLAKVVDLTIGEPISKPLTKENALEATAHMLAKINHLNREKMDGFMFALIDHRADLRGLPYLMGDECRTNAEQARVFRSVADFVNRTAMQSKVTGKRSKVKNMDHLWLQIGSLTSPVVPDTFLASMPELAQADQATIHRATVAALMQIVIPSPEHDRLGLPKTLTWILHTDATKALAKLALFAPEDQVRAAAIEGLKLRSERDYTDVLMQGFRYPLPAVSKRAAEALVKLDRQDLLSDLVDVLDRPDPRLPVTEKKNGKEVTFVRELVKVNHHRNCVLCHAPGTEKVPEGVLKVAVSLPTEPLAKPAEGGYQSMPPVSPDIVVRLDMTYLRQDFSRIMPVADPHPWPEMQRFDFLVRTRQLTPTEAQAYQPCCEMEEPGRLSPYHRSALYALRELTGRDTEPTAAAWRKLLKLQK